MGLSDEQFWSLTPREFAALFDQWKLGQKREDYRAALICSVIANVNRTKKHKAFRPSDFMPKEVEEKKPQTWQDQLKVVEMWNKALSGKDLRH